MDALLTVKDVSRILKVNIITVRRYLNAGLLKGTKIGMGTIRCRWRIKEQDLNDFISGKKEINQ